MHKVLNSILSSKQTGCGSSHLQSQHFSGEKTGRPRHRKPWQGEAGGQAKEERRRKGGMEGKNERDRRKKAGRKANLLRLLNAHL